MDRVTGRVSPINLPDFDPLYSAASWYRDYIAYCGVSDDGKKLYAIVAQLGRRKPVLKKPVGDATADGTPDSECPAPAWQRQPTRVTFRPEQGPGLTFTVRGHVVDVVNDAEGEEGNGITQPTLCNQTRTHPHLIYESVPRVAEGSPGSVTVLPAALYSRVLKRLPKVLRIGLRHRCSATGTRTYKSCSI